MENAVLIGLSRQMALGRELDVIANNVANVSTTGFKARSSRFRTHLQSVASAASARSADRKIAYPVDAGTPLDTSSGAIERTGNPLDLALKGDGFFAVQTPAGERYTRDGAFQLDANGTLVTSDGYAVAGERGPISISPQEKNVAVGADRTVSTDQGQRGKLRLVRFASVDALTSEGGNLFVSRTPALTRLMEVSRAYAESAALVSRLDDLKRSAISRLADTAAN